METFPKELTQDFTATIEDSYHYSFVKDMLASTVQRRVLAIQFGLLLDLLFHRLELFFT